MDNISFNTGWTIPEYDYITKTCFIWSCGKHSSINVNNLKSIQITACLFPYNYPNNIQINGTLCDLSVGDNIININVEKISHVEISVENTFIGNDVHNNFDTRELGVMVKKIMIMPIDAFTYSEIDVTNIKINQVCDVVHKYVDTTPKISKEIVISHYTENLEWTKLLPIKYKIYSKTLDTNLSENIIGHTNINRGQEALGYLDYILDNYNTLPDKILFFHSDTFPWHQDRCIFCILDNIDWNVNYKSINNPNIIFYASNDNPKNKKYNDYQRLIEHMRVIFKNYLPIPNKIKTIGGAQFIVDKSLILQYPPEFYKNIKDWILNVEVNYPPLYYERQIINNKVPYAYHGNLLELAWHYIFTKNEIEL